MEKLNILRGPANHPLQNLLRELKFGRPAQQQILLEKFALIVEKGGFRKRNKKV